MLVLAVVRQRAPTFKHCIVYTSIKPSLSPACAKQQWYLNHSGGDFEVFHPTRDTCYTDGGVIWRAGVHQKSTHPHQISPPSVQTDVWLPKPKILPDFKNKILKHKPPAETHPLSDFYEIIGACR